MALPRDADVQLAEPGRQWAPSYQQPSLDVPNRASVEMYKPDTVHDKLSREVQLAQAMGQGFVQRVGELAKDPKEVALTLAEGVAGGALLALAVRKPGLAATATRVISRGLGYGTLAILGGTAAVTAGLAWNSDQNMDELKTFSNLVGQAGPDLTLSLLSGGASLQFTAKRAFGAGFTGGELAKQIPKLLGADAITAAPRATYNFLTDRSKSEQPIKDISTTGRSSLVELFDKSTKMV